MPCITSWFDETQRVILFTVTDPWTWSDFYPAFKEARDMIVSVNHPHPVHTIVDLRASDILPPNMITHLRSANRSQLENSGVKVFVTSSRLMQLIYDTVIRVLHNDDQKQFLEHFTIVDSWDEAMLYLQKIQAEEDTVPPTA